MDYLIEKLIPFGVLVKPKNQDFKVGDLDIGFLKNLFREEQLVLLRGFKTFKNSQSFSDYCESWGEVSVWPFGKVLELIQQEEPKDHIFDHSYVPLHWDGMYRTQVPEYQIFHCVKAPLQGQGGRTTFSNTIKLLSHLTEDKKVKWKNTIGVYRREMEFYNSKVVSPIITKHPYRGYDVIRYNESHSSKKGKLINIPNISFKGIEYGQLNNFYNELDKALYNKENFYAHEWQDRDIVIADNFSLLHGREEFQSNAPRHIQRVQVHSDPPFDNPNLETYS